MCQNNITQIEKIYKHKSPRSGCSIQEEHSDQVIFVCFLDQNIYYFLNGLILKSIERFHIRNLSTKYVLMSYFVSFKAVVLLLLIRCPIVGICNCSMFCCALRYVHSSFAITLMGKRELVALLCLSSWCLLIPMWLSLGMLRVCGIS